MVNFCNCQMTQSEHAKIDVVQCGSITRQLSTQTENVAKVKYSLKQWIILATLAFGNFCNSASISLQAPFFPAEAEKKGATLTESGFIFGIQSIAAFVTALFIGKLMSYISPKILLNAGFLTIGVSCIAFGFLDLVNDSTTFIALAFTLRICEGVGGATFRTASYTVTAAQFPDRVGSTFALLLTFNGVGLFAGRTIGGALYDIGGYGLPFYVVGSMLLIDTMVIFFLLPDVENKRLPEKNNFLQIFLHPSTLIYSLSVFTATNYIGFNTATLEPHLREFNLSGFLLGTIFSIGGAVYAVFAPFVGWLMDKKFDNQLVSLWGSFFIVIAVLLIGPAPFLSLRLNLGLVIVSRALGGLAIAAKRVSAFTGILQSTKNRGFPSDLSTYGVVSSVMASSASLGSFAGSSIGGYLLDEFGYRNASMYLIILDNILIFLLVISLFKSVCGRTTSISFPEEPVVSMDKSSSIFCETYNKRQCNPVRDL